MGVSFMRTSFELAESKLVDDLMEFTSVRAVEGVLSTEGVPLLLLLSSHCAVITMAMLSGLTNDSSLSSGVPGIDPGGMRSGNTCCCSSNGVIGVVLVGVVSSSNEIMTSLDN